MIKKPYHIIYFFTVVNTWWLFPKIEYAFLAGNTSLAYSLLVILFLPCFLPIFVDYAIKKEIDKKFYYYFHLDSPTFMMTTNKKRLIRFLLVMLFCLYLEIFLYNHKAIDLLLFSIYILIDIVDFWLKNKEKFFKIAKVVKSFVFGM